MIIIRSYQSKTSKRRYISSYPVIKGNGIDNISIDLMYALPEQSLEDIKKDLEIFLDLDIKHLSIYSLQIEENSIFGRQNLKPVDEDIEADMYELICRTMEKLAIFIMKSVVFVNQDTIQSTIWLIGRMKIL